MMLRTLLLLLALVPLAAPLQAGMWDNMKGYFTGNVKSEPPTIEILLLHDIKGTNLEVQGEYIVYDPFAKKPEGYKRFIGKSRYIQALSDGIKWGESFPGTHQIEIKPTKPSTFTIINNQVYKGSVFIYGIEESRTITIVNQVPIESYVNSILDNYVNQELEPETLAALAIVARTNAYFQAKNPKNEHWSVDAEKVGYQGVNLDSMNENNAVRLTRCMIMSRTGVYEGMSTPFAAQLGTLSPGQSKGVEVSKISLEEANEMAKKGEHAAQILAKAFPKTTIMLIDSSN